MKKLSKVTGAGNKICLFFFFLPIVMLLAGCNNVKVSSDFDKTHDFIAFNTYSFTPSIKHIRLDAHNNYILEYEVDQVMRTRGYQKLNSANTDLLVDVYRSYYAKIDVTESINGDIYGIGFSNTTSNYHEFAVGKLFIYAVDAKKKLVLWQGKGTAKIETKRTDLEKEKITIMQLVKFS
jgi:hypothetical protein